MIHLQPGDEGVFFEDGTHPMQDQSTGALAKAPSGTVAATSSAAIRRPQWMVGSKEYLALRIPASP